MDARVIPDQVGDRRPRMTPGTTPRAPDAAQRGPLTAFAAPAETESQNPAIHDKLRSGAGDCRRAAIDRKQLMLRHKWFKILIALQIVNFAAMVLLEQQRRSIWNKEAANTQRIIDTRFFTEKTEENYKYLAKLVDDMQTRLTEVQGAAARDASNAARLRDVQARVNVLQSEAEQNASNAALLRDVQTRVNELQAAAAQNASNAALLTDIQARVNAIQIDAGKNTNTAAMLADIQGRVNALQIEAGKNVGIGALIKDTRDRVLNLESALQKPRSDK
jgi:acetyl/propionyl-CoA carboxylase alpha subunit